MSDFLSNLAARSLAPIAADSERAAGAVQPRRASRFEPRAALIANVTDGEPELDGAAERIVASDAALRTPPSSDETALQQLLRQLSTAARRDQPAADQPRAATHSRDSGPPQPMLIPQQIAAAPPHAASSDRSHLSEHSHRSDPPAPTHDHAATQPVSEQISRQSEPRPAPRRATLHTPPDQIERPSQPRIDQPQPNQADRRAVSRAPHETIAQQPTATLAPLVREIIVERLSAPPSPAPISRSQSEPATPAASTGQPRDGATSPRPQPLQPQITRYVAPPAPEIAPPAPPAIQVTIGRIEVRATATPSPARPTQRSGPAVMTLEEYVRQRKEGGSR